MIAKLRYILFILLLPAASPALGQGTSLNPDIRRALFHDYVDRQQQVALRSEGQNDKKLNVSRNEEINFLVTDALVRRVDELQYKYEKDSVLSHSQKIRYIRGIEDILKYMNADKSPERKALLSLPAVLDAYESCVLLDVDSRPIDSLVSTLRYDVAVPLVRSNAFALNSSIKNCRDILVKKYCELYPDEILPALRQNTDISFADSLIRVAAKRDPMSLYDYAAASNELGYKIRSIRDPLVQAVSKMAVSPGSGQLYFPFIDNIVAGKLDFPDVDAVKDKPEQYYKLLVKTRIDYVDRAIRKDTAYGFRALTEMLTKKASDVFINVINGLHEEPDAVRFRIIQQLNAQELYYLAVLSDGEIYTSSYVKGVYPLMMEKVNHNADSLLMLVRFDKFRKFIKMAAGYNTLNNFLSQFSSQDNAEKLMKAFVNNLEKSEGLEDGVDVADSYASIAEENTEVARRMLQNVQYNHTVNYNTNNKRGAVIYELLSKLFLSADSNSKVDISKEFGIPPVYDVGHKALENDSNRVIMQVMFYGDKDGQSIFGGFQRMFSSANWKITSTPYWVSITSVKGNPVTIYANKPLPEETGEDEKAQRELNAYLLKNNLQPTVVIHRGHSYYAEATIDQILPSAKIVFMGSCGGYHLINDILKKAPDAHIIASKQIGKAAINKPFFNLLMEKVRTGNNIDWIPFWKEFEKSVNVEGFEDYIPPYKNLGALFIKGYNTAMARTDSNL